jgi:PhzF family phenazine biosynthesis protein
MNRQPSRLKLRCNFSLENIMGQETLYRLAAFANGNTGGNPAGVWVGDALPDAKSMQAIAKDVGFSETAFVAPASGRERTIRYYSPEAEVSFCGHATIATGVVLGQAEGEGSYRLSTAAGEVPVHARRHNGDFVASLTSVVPRHKPVPGQLLDAVLPIIGWTQIDLDDAIPPVIAYAGAWHLVLAASKAQLLASLDYDFDALKALMLEYDLTTLQLVWRENDSHFHSRNPFPVGGVVEDPATGASAAAFGGYLRNAGIISAPFSFTIRQGEAMGRPSRLSVEVPESGGVVVSGTAIAI